MTNIDAGSQRIRRLPDKPIVGETYPNAGGIYKVDRYDAERDLAWVHRPKDGWKCCAHGPALYDVPVLLVTGDLGVCEQAKRLCPAIYTVPVSRGCGNGSISIHPAEAVKRIREKAEMAVADGIAHPEKFAVALPNNFDVEVEFVKHNRARRASFYPGVKQIGPRTVRFSSDAYYDVLRFFMFCL